METITEFQGDYRFLSNFYPSPVILDGKRYTSVEHAYQAAKTLDEGERRAIRDTLTAGRAKRMGKNVTLRKDWESIKLSVMEDLIRQKFQATDLKEALLETGDAKLEEGNDWGDTFWGVSRGTGKNHLGKILMRIRDELSTTSIKTY